MRPLLAILIAASILGAVGAYMAFQANLPEAADVRQLARSAEGKFSIEITLTFEPQPDAFGFDKQTEAIVRFGARDLLSDGIKLSAGAPTIIDDVPEVKVGRNEFYVEFRGGDVSLAENDGFSFGEESKAGGFKNLVSRAVRIRVLRDGASIDGAETTLWSEPGQPVAGLVVVDVPAAGEENHVHH